MYYIYCYTNKNNGMKYIGQTCDLKRRDYEHKHGSSTYFDRAYSKHPDDFELEILRIFQDNKYTKDVLDATERYYIAHLNTQAPNGYNLTEGGQRQGYDMDEERFTEQVEESKPSIFKRICNKLFGGEAQTTTEEVKEVVVEIKPEVVEVPSEPIAQEAKKVKRQRTTFEGLHLPVGSVLYWKNDMTITVVVADKTNKVIYNEEQCSISAAALKIWNDTNEKQYTTIDGYDMFLNRVNGETLWSMRKRMEENESYGV